MKKQNLKSLDLWAFCSGGGGLHNGGDTLISHNYWSSRRDNVTVSYGQH